MLNRSDSPRWIAMFAIVSVGILSSSAADAQGLFRRLRSRIESRVAPVAPSTQAPQTTGRGVDPTAQRLSPLNPTRPGGNSVESQGQGQSPFGGSILSRKPATDSGSESDRTEGTEAKGSAQTEGSSRPTMGIQVLPTSEGTPGLRVAGIRQGSLAGQAGLKTDDLIVSVDGKATPNIDAIAEILNQRRPGDRIFAKVMRGDKVSTIAIPLLDPAKLRKQRLPQRSPS